MRQHRVCRTRRVLGKDQAQIGTAVPDDDAVFRERVALFERHSFYDKAVLQEADDRFAVHIVPVLIEAVQARRHIVLAVVAPLRNGETGAVEEVPDVLREVHHQFGAVLEAAAVAEVKDNHAVQRVDVAHREGDGLAAVHDRGRQTTFPTAPVAENDIVPRGGIVSGAERAADGVEVSGVIGVARFNACGARKANRLLYVVTQGARLRDGARIVEDLEP